MKTSNAFLASFALTLSACGAAPSVETTDDSQARLVSVADGEALGPVDVRITRACVTRSPMIHSAQDGNYYTYTVELDIANASPTAGDFEVYHRGSLAMPEDGYSSPLPVTDAALLTPIAIGASSTSQVVDTVDSQSSFLNYWDVKVRSLRLKFPSYKMQRVIIDQPMESDPSSEISHCLDF